MEAYNTVIKSMLEYGALGLLAAVGFVMFFFEKRRADNERDRVSTLTDKLFELSRESLKSDMESAEAYKGMEKIMDGMLSVLSAGRGKNGDER